MTANQIKDLFANDISRRIEEVIKVDQADEQIIRDELGEYVVTDSIRDHMLEILDRYWETPKKPHEGVAVWVSGFFGSGKSSFAKYLGLALENRQILGEGAAALLGQRTADQKVQVLLNNIAENIPTEAVIFDVSTDRGIRTGNQTITEIMYRLFLQSLGYARDLDLSELEITLEEHDRLNGFKAKYEEVFGKAWDVEKGKIALAVQQASRVMHALEPETYPTADSWRESALKRADVTPGDLAKRGLDEVVDLDAFRQPCHEVPGYSLDQRRIPVDGLVFPAVETNAHRGAHERTFPAPGAPSAGKLERDATEYEDTSMPAAFHL